MRKRGIFKRLSVFWTTILTFLVVYFLLAVGIPYLSMLLAGRDEPLPVPGTLMAIYLALTAVGLLVYLAFDENRLKEFWAPVQSFLRGPQTAQPARRLDSALRWAVLAAVPLLAGWVMYSSVAPSSKPPTALRTQHPTIPFAYEKLTNPYRNPDGSVDPAVIEEGRLLYQVNCRPCHGTPAAGDGPMAYGFRLRPANFRSEDTIVTVIESYAFWRVKEGGPGLPNEGSPWDSAMPAWEGELTDDEIWKIVAAEYHMAGVSPRRPEALPEAGLSNAAAAGGAALRGAAALAPQAQASGEALYQEWCGFCHGETGDGNGPVAPYLNPRPRDFTSGQFKFRTTASGELPLREDVIDIVKRGVQASAMPAWEDILTDTEIEEVVDYIMQSFVPDWGTYEPAVIPIPRAPRVTAGMVEEGKQLYQDLQCWKCHGQGGRSDGPSAPTLRDDLDYPIRTTDLTEAWSYKGGSELADIYTRFSTGMNGTPMPSFYDVFPEEERADRLWALSAYVHSLQQNQPSGTSVVSARRIAGALPAAPDDPTWEQATPVSFFLSGQVIARPRWQNPSVSAVTVQALHNDQQLAMLVEWNDPFQDTEGDNTAAGETIGIEDTYVNLDTFGQESSSDAYVDALAVQFPQSPGAGMQKPFFLWGQAGMPVNLWKWQADGAVAEFNAAGVRGGLAQQESSQVTASASWADGRYRLLLTRPLSTGDANDVELVPGQFIPVAFQAWDGSNDEAGLRMSLSSWYSLVLEKPTPVSAFAYTGLMTGLVAAAEWLLVRRSRKIDLK
jgi:mono/diheme cytochrome c family protein